MFRELAFSHEALLFIGPEGTEILKAHDVTGIDICEMANAPFHGDEEFHIIHGPDAFWLVGPFAAGALRAIKDCLAVFPAIPTRTVTVGKMPWALRKPSVFGLRLFPIPGFLKAPTHRLSDLKITALQP